MVFFADTELVRLEGTSRGLMVHVLLRQGPLVPAAQDCVRRVLNISEEGDSASSPGNPCQCLVSVTSEKMSPHVPMFQLAHITSGSVTCHQ